MRTLRALPKVRDSLSYLYVEQCRVERDANAVAVHDADGKTSIPCASLTLLMLGPGTTITHAAVRVLAQNGCLVAWTGEEAVRFYAQGLGETRSAKNLHRQARAWADPAEHMQVVGRLYQHRFSEELEPGLTLRQVRGKEGIRVRDVYRQASEKWGVPWHGRRYDRKRWRLADPVNRAISAANAALYGVCQAAILSTGYSPALGFIHTGHVLAFVHDIADLYKTEVSIPAAFQATSEGTADLASRTRRLCRDTFSSSRLLSRIIPDIEQVIGSPAHSTDDHDGDDDVPLLWDGMDRAVAGGVDYADASVGDVREPAGS